MSLLLGLFRSRWLLLYGAPVLLLALAASHGWAYRAGVSREADRQAAAQLAVERVSARLLATRTAQVRATEQSRRDLATKLEVTHVERDADINAALAENRRLAAALGGLRDPGRQPAGCGGAVRAATAAPAGAADGAAGAELSAAASGFLLEFAARADRAAAYALTCHQWVSALRAAP